MDGKQLSKAKPGPWWASPWATEKGSSQEGWAIYPGEVEPPALTGESACKGGVCKPPTQPDLQRLELSARGLTKQQFYELVQQRIRQTPPDILQEYIAMGVRFRRHRAIESEWDFVNVELGDVVGIKDLGLDPDFAHEITSRMFPGLREKLPSEKSIRG